MTLLHAAVRAHQPHIARFLLHAGADPLARDTCGRSALHELFGPPPADEPSWWPQSPAQHDLSGRVRRAVISEWLGVCPEGPLPRMRCARHGVRGLCALQQLLLLEDACGRAPITDMCAGCGAQYATCLKLPCGAPRGPQHETTSLHTAALHAQALTPKCVCGGLVWRVAVEQSLRVCALIAPDALRAPSRPGGVLGLLRCSRAGPLRPEAASEADPAASTALTAAALLADLPADVRALICQKSCIAIGLRP
jgi:Ankyrin repeat